MSKYFNFKSIPLFLPVIFFLSSCQDEKKTDDNSNSAASTSTATSTNTATVPEPKKAALTGTLDNLWIEAATFRALRDNKKIVFSFTFRDPDILTLWGWQCKNDNCTDNFPDPPALELKKWNPSTISYGPNVIFGNVVIFRKDVKTIMDWIDKGYNYVVFVPNNAGDYIRYDIKVTNDDPKAVTTTLTLEDTGIDTNPSPPKNNSN